MAKLILISAFCLLAVATQAATYRDAQLPHRVVRSPHYGEHFHDNQPLYPPPPFPPQPPPPPFIYRTHNWSGVGRNIGGAGGGVFSGAAASAQSEIPAANAAFSLAEAGAVQGQFEAQSAESDDNSGSNGFKNSGHYNSNSESSSHKFGSHSEDYSKSKSGHSDNGGYSGLNSHITRDESSGFFGQSKQNTASNSQELNRGYGQSSSFNSDNTGSSGGYGGGYNKNFKESLTRSEYVQNGEGNQYGSQQSGVNRNQRNFDEGSQSHSGRLSGSQAQSSSSDKSGQYATSQGSAQSGAKGYGYGNDNRRSEVRGYENQAYGSGSFKAQQLKSTEESAGYGATVDGQMALSGSNNGAGYGQHQTALHGALELASQGLQAAKNSECSTCQKSTYALSNAKSHSGSAIALSIGG
nr:RNA-binding protein FUS-like [Vanessa tameamea]